MPNGIHVALATCHDKLNYGSMLQAWALQRFLELRGYEVRTIDKVGLARAISVGRKGHYARHWNDVPMYEEKVPFAWHRARQKIVPAFGREMRERRNAFDAFARKHFRLTRRTFSFDEIHELSTEYDAVVVGSDQLWLPVNIAGDYFTLSWVDSSVRKVAYATSFGVTSLDKWTSQAAHEFLSSFDSVSVREESGADIVQSITGTRPEVVCDPTMLLSPDDWREVACKRYDKIPHEPYLLTYFMGRNAWQRNAAAACAKRLGLRIVAIAHNDSYVTADDGYADVYPWDAGPAEWLALFEHASLVCTDSFHGTVFSNVFQTPFVSFRRHTESSGQSTNSRLDTLLGMLGLEERLCETPEMLDAIAQAPIDWSVSNQSLVQYRETSAAWFDTALAFESKQAPRHITASHREECCGCSACAAACPIRCVAMVFDEEGCEYPQVDDTKCIGCGKCVRACPVINVKPEKEKPQRAFLVQHTDTQVLAESTSGGAMTALAQAIIADGGIVFGAGYLLGEQLSRAVGAPGRLVVGHFGVEREDELWRFRNSKYVQSVVGPAFQEVKEELAGGKEVLFTGTPCQCEGLITYLGAHPVNLYVADIICHAIVCRAAFSSYEEWLKENVGEAGYLRFRDKSRYGYSYSNVCATSGESGHEEVLYSAGVESDPYLRAFFSNLSDRPICYQCPFKKRYRESDLTCWDCFDVGRFTKYLNNNRGVTRVLVHSENGLRLFDKARAYLKVKELCAEAAVAGVREMTQSIDVNPNRTRFMLDVVTMTPDELVRTWLPDSLAVKTERFFRILTHRLGVYEQVKHVVKQLLGK